MSDFVDALVELLPEHNSMKDPNNELRVVLNKCLGTWFDDHQVETVHDNVFFNLATGKYLDLFGNDYGVYRRTDESDDDYRNRILMEKLDYLTPLYLQTIYGLVLYAYVSEFDATKNTLTSDNPYITNQYMSIGSLDVKIILNKKFVLDNSILWLNDYKVDYIIDVDGVDLLVQYKDIYLNNDVSNYFNDNGSLKSVKLDLPNATNCYHMFRECSSLVDVNLELPNATNCYWMFTRCSSLVDVNLELPNATNCYHMFTGCSSLVDVNLELPNATNCYWMFTGCSSLVDVELELQNATDCESMFRNCSSLINVELNLPKLSNYQGIFSNAPKIETINVNIPVDKVTDFKSYVLGLNLENLTSFKINGEEQL